MHTAAAIPPEWDRAVAYGDGLFETMVVFDGAVPLLVYHQQRLHDSLQRLAIACDLTLVEQEITDFARRAGNGLLKLVIARQGGPRGYDTRKATGTTVSMQVFPLPQYPAHRRTDGIRLHLCRQRLAADPALAGIKHLNRLQQAIAASELNREIAEEGLMLDANGAIIEGTVSNVFLFAGGELLTPRLDQCGVAGVMRAAILHELAPSLGLPVRECRITLADLLAADAVFVCNSVFGIWPVRSLGVSELQQSPGLCKQFFNLLDSAGYGRLYG